MMHAFMPLIASASSLINTGTAAACGGGNCGPGSINTVFKEVTNILVFLVGAVSVIFIIIGGLRYVTSNGDSKATEAAKNTVLYAVIGIVVAIAAYAIVSFVTANIG